MAVGILELLYHWSAKYAIKGDIGKWPDQIIAPALGWPYEPSELIGALVRCRWLDEDQAFRLVIHDIKDHADNTWRQCLEDAGLTWWDGTPPRGQRRGRQHKPQFNSSQTPVSGISLERALQKNSSKTPVSGISLEQTLQPDSSETPESGVSLELRLQRNSSEIPQPEPEPEPEPEP